jgi:hypothetical protein
MGANDTELEDGTTGARIALPPTTILPIHIHGTVVTSSSTGDLQLKWAQSTANSAPTSVLEGGYLRAEEI